MTEINVDSKNPFYMSEDGVVYNKDKTVLVLCPNGKKGEFTVTEGVTEIGDYAFYSCESLTDIILPESLTTIGNSGFRYCFGISNMILPNGLKKIGAQAFYNDYRLADITIPGSVTEIGTEAFYFCPFTSITIPGSVTHLGDRTFCLDKKLTKVVIEEGVKSIGAEAFYQCETLTDVTLPESLTEIGDSAFIMCWELPKITLPEGLESIGDGAFQGCNLKRVKISENVTKIGESAFSGCDWGMIIYGAQGSLAQTYAKENEIRFTSAAPDANGFTVDNGVLVDYVGAGGDIVIPQNVLSIQEKSLGSNPDLTSVTIAGNVLVVEGYSFWNSRNLTEIKVDSENPLYDSEDGILYNKGKTQLLICPDGKGGKIVLPETVKDIRATAFFDNKIITEVIIPEGAKKIGDGTFQDCINLERVVIPESMKEIGFQVFWGCENLTDVTLPEGLESIGHRTFGYCEKLTHITIPGSVKEIPDYLLYDCKSLTSVVISEGVEKIDKVVFLGCQALTTVEIPESVTSIGADVFPDNDNLVIVCTEGSYAEEYAKANGILYRHFGDDPEQPTNPTEPEQPITPEQPTTLEQPTNPMEPEQPTNPTNPEQPTNPTKPEQPTSPENPTTPEGSTEQPEKTEQTITAKDITKTYGDKAFSLGAKTNGGGKLTYKVMNKKIATVDKKGKVTIKGCGRTQIKITAAAKGKYPKTTKTITLTVKPKKTTVASVKSTKAKTLTVKWKQDKTATGYIVQYSADKKFKKNVKTAVVSKNKTTSKTVTKLKGGKKYYVRVCAYTTADGEKIRGSYSKVMNVKVKK